LGENLVQARIHSLERKFSRLGENSPESTLAPEPFSLGRLYPRPAKLPSRLGEALLGWAKLDSRTPLKFPSDFAWAKYAENNSLSGKSWGFYYLKATIHASDD